MASDAEIEEGRGAITPVPAKARATWAGDARRLAENGDDALLWPEFGNADDATLAW